LKNFRKSIQWLVDIFNKGFLLTGSFALPILFDESADPQELIKIPLKTFLITEIIWQL
jgi:hypothetical protein